MQSVALVIHVILAVVVIGLVLMQHGKGADAGAAFGSGASATVFGARGSASFLTRATTIAAFLFFLTSVSLFYMAAHRDSAIRSVTDLPGVAEEVVAPAPLDAPQQPSDLPGGVDQDLPPAASEANSESVNTDSDMPAPPE